METITNLDGYVGYDKNFLSLQEADELYAYCLDHLPWEQDEVTIFGKTHLIPRQQAYLADHEDLQYGYSGHQLKVHHFSPTIEKIKEKLKHEYNLSFNAMLANLYEHGQHSNGWHADNEKELCVNPSIASISLGQTRKFKIKHNKSKSSKDILLEHGSLLLMQGAFQENWKHTIPKTAKKVDPRVNLTFRSIKS